MSYDHDGHTLNLATIQLKQGHVASSFPSKGQDYESADSLLIGRRHRCGSVSASHVDRTEYSPAVTQKIHAAQRQVKTIGMEEYRRVLVMR